MSKQVTNLAIIAILLAVAYFGGVTGAIIAAVATVLVLVNVVKIDSKPNKALMLLVLIGIVLIGGLVPAEWGAKTPTLSTSQYTVTTPEQKTVAQSVGQTLSAVLKINAKADLGGTYAGTGTFYALAPTDAGYDKINNRYDLMKKVADGDTIFLNGKSLSLSSGVFSYSGFAGKQGDVIKIFGYQDATPAAAENISFFKTISLTGITAGSTPEWMVSNPTYTWGSYAQMSWKDSSDIDRAKYFDNETATVSGRVFRLYTHPVVNGQALTDTKLYIESSTANAANIKKVKVIAPNLQTVETTALQDTGNMASNNPTFLAAPSLNVSTNKMYYAVDFPDGGDDGVKTGSSHLGTYNIEITYDHPASGNVSYMIYLVQNGNALTSTGGHFDGVQAFNFSLEQNADADAWTSS